MSGSLAQRCGYCWFGNSGLWSAQLILSDLIAILEVLLFEADFFVDGKDLQTFVGATFQSRFF